MWTKPPSLQDKDIEVKDEWQEFTLPDGTVTFMNPKTGQYSRLTTQDAAKVIQRRVRWRQVRAFGTAGDGWCWASCLGIVCP